MRKRTTIRFEPQVLRAVRRKAAVMGCSMSDVVNDAVRRTVAEDAADLAAFAKRRDEPTIDLAKVAAPPRRRRTSRRDGGAT